MVADGADAATWEELRRRAKAASTPQDRLRHQYALADSPDPALVLRLCELVMTDEVRTQDGAFVLRRALANRRAVGAVWTFVADHWDELTTRFPGSMLPRLLEGVRGVSDRDLARTISTFIDEHPLPQGATVVRQHHERMWVSVEVAGRIHRELGPALA